jgi:hypothetical protein
MRLSAVSCNAKSLVFVPVLSSALMLFSQLPVHANESVTLAWVRSSATNVTGYKIYYGTACRGYSTVVTVGNTTNATISGLVPARTYYFAATAMDGTGNESGYSLEVSYVMPVTAATLTEAVRSSRQFSFTVTGDTGQQYVVQASTNLLDWVSLQTNAAPFLFADTNAAGFHQRYYRTYYLSP